MARPLNKADCLRILGLGEQASAHEIRRAFRGLVLEHHPDCNPGDPASRDRFLEVVKAHHRIKELEREAAIPRVSAVPPWAMASAAPNEWPVYGHATHPRANRCGADRLRVALILWFVLGGAAILLLSYDPEQPKASTISRGGRERARSVSGRPKSLVGSGAKPASPIPLQDKSVASGGRLASVDRPPLADLLKGASQTLPKGPVASPGGTPVEHEFLRGQWSPGRPAPLGTIDPFDWCDLSRPTLWLYPHPLSQAGVPLAADMIGNRTQYDVRVPQVWRQLPPPEGR